MEIDSLPARRWLECASCVEGWTLEDGGDAQKLATDHTRERPWHTRFRVVNQVNFRVVPTGTPEPSTQ
jgi:hypothetical protein